MQFATNHFSHFALAAGLHGALAAAGGARVRAYEPWLAYGQYRRDGAEFF
jgi:hypothetical protein